jgi:hypothetical protein
MSVRVFPAVGTTASATLLQDFSSSLSSGFGGTQQNRYFPPSTAIPSYTTVAGDVLVVEIGTKWFTASSGGTVTSGIRFGDSGTVDLPVDETTGVAAPEQNSWIEFESVNLFGDPDDFLPTLSASSVAIRPAAPDKPGLQFFDRATKVESIWNGTVWTDMVSTLSVNGVTGIGGVIGFSSTFGVSVTITGTTVTWDAQALSAETNRNRTLRLTDDVTEGALLTASSTFGVNAAAILAPNATNAVRIGKYGNLALAGTALTDQYLMSFTKTNFNEATVGPIALNFTMTNQGIGDAQGLVRGLNASISGNLAQAVAPSFRNVEGVRIAVTGGAGGNSYFQGSLITFRSFSTTVSSSVVGTTVVSIVDFQSSNTNTITRALVADRISFEAKGAVTLLISGALNNHYGFFCNALTAGNTRIQYEARPISTGTPAIAYGYRSALHSVGTLRRSFIGDNSMECTQNRIIVGTSGMGVVVQDTVDGNYYQIYSANGFIQTVSLGATLPAV